MSTPTPEQTPEPDDSGHESIYVLMGRVMADVGAIGKSRVNTDQKFKFRGIEDVKNALHPVLVRHGVFYLPIVQGGTYETRQTAKGSLLNATRLRVAFRFYGPAGDFVDAVLEGEAHDSADKATNKALSAAEKYALTMAFCIPTEEQADSDRHHEEGARETQASIRARNKELRRRIADFAKEQGWDIAATSSEFESDYGKPPADARPEDLMDFLDVLRARAQGAVAVEPKNVPEAETQGEGVEAKGTPPEGGAPPHPSSGGQPTHEFYAGSPGGPCRECDGPKDAPWHIEPGAQWFRDALLRAETRVDARRLYHRALAKGLGDVEVADANGVLVRLEDLGAQRMKETT